MRRKRNLFVFIAVFLVLCIEMNGLTGCRSDVEPGPGPSTEITLWFWWDQEHEKRELKELIDEFHESQDQIRIQLHYVPAEDFKKRMALSMADGEMPDLALIDSADFVYLHSMQPFAELTDQLEELDAYIPQVMSSCENDGKIYGLPFGFSCSVLYYNKEIFQRNGLEVPETWEALYETAAALSNEWHYGFALPMFRAEESVFNFLPFFWSGGGELDHLESEESKRAFSFLRRLAKDGAMSRQTVNLTAGDLAVQFAEGNIVMMMNSSAMVNSVRELNPELDFGTAVPPMYDKSTSEISSLGGATVFGVTRGEHQEEAIAFLRYVSKKERMQEYISDFGFMAPRKDVLDIQFAGDEEKQRILEIAVHSGNRELSVDWPYISEIFAEVMEEEIIGEQEEEMILHDAAVKMEEIRGEGQ